MKLQTHHIVIAAIAAYIIYRHLNTPAPSTAGGGGGGGSYAGGGGYSPPRQTYDPLTPQTQTVYTQVRIPTAIRTTNPSTHWASNQLVAAQSAIPYQNSGSVTGFDNYGIFGLCDTSNKLTLYGTNNNFNAATLRY
jgi:hypothetical protein